MVLTFWSTAQLPRTDTTAVNTVTVATITISNSEGSMIYFFYYTTATVEK